MCVRIDTENSLRCMASAVINAMHTHCKEVPVLVFMEQVVHENEQKKTITYQADRFRLSTSSALIVKHKRKTKFLFYTAAIRFIL